MGQERSAASPSSFRQSSPISLAALAAGIAAGAAFAASSPKAPQVQTVAEVDLKRYAGKWYEIARFPNRFQRDCSGEVAATYTLRPDGKITVLNECRTAEGKVKRATGTARLASSNGPNSKLKVTFFWPFSGDYWVIGLDPEYRWAVVGDPGRDYLWFLSRTPQVSDETYRKLTGIAAQQGFAVSRLVRTKQNERGSASDRTTKP